MSTRPLGGESDAVRSIREELDKCRKAVKSQRYVIARHEAMLRWQRRLVAISLTAALVLAAVTALAVTVQWL